MKTADEVFNKVLNLPMTDLLRLCAEALENKMEEKRLDTLLRQVLAELSIEVKS